MKTPRKKRYSRATIIGAHILKNLMSTVPMLVGCFVIIYAVCAYQYSWAGFAKFSIEFLLGGGLLTLGALIFDYFEN